MKPTTNARTLARRALAALHVAAASAAAHAQWVDYAQADKSSKAGTLVLVKALGGAPRADSPSPLASLSYARWSTGESLAIGYVHRWTLAGDAQHWIVGAGVGANAFASRDSDPGRHESAFSARAQSEWFGPTAGGSYYALLQASSFRGSWLATAQYAPERWPLVAEWTRYHEREYQATSLGARIRLQAPRWFVRLGVTRAQDESTPYVGLAYNGF